MQVIDFLQRGVYIGVYIFSNLSPIFMCNMLRA